MTDSLRPRIDFEDPLQVSSEPVLKPAQVFDGKNRENFSPISPELEAEEREGQVEGIVNTALKPKRSFWRKMVHTALILLAVSVVAQSVQWVYQSWQQQDWIALGATAAGGMIVFAGMGSIISEWRRLYRLRMRAEERDTARELLQNHGVGKGREFCEKLASQAGIDPHHPALQRWQAALHDTHNDREVVVLYGKLVQPVLDSQARAEISRYAAESALMIAVSPLAIIDMAFIAWRNIRLINRIAALYGIELGYFSRIRLFRLVLINIVFSGVSEMVREAGMDWLSQDIAARLSARVAQGIGVGLLTARLGIKAMELCRPLPWIEGDKPKLGDFRRQLITQLKNIIPNKSKNVVD
ncbi:YcjF family protein [Photorhabdus heterorhabditis]|uniref:YcjF family protein n=1 Tax=Photorhabdus heterorhabditis TaxID=880156 RepID=UPI001561E0AD|nr:YcjF family protein [Photorhabdus heterorhabditis]NRN27625.1 TIGR01620 family protein [Photorhabdus heterorhabditis subsp. aluminescens]